MCVLSAHLQNKLQQKHQTEHFNFVTHTDAPGISYKDRTKIHCTESHKTFENIIRLLDRISCHSILTHVDCTKYNGMKMHF